MLLAARVTLIHWDLIMNDTVDMLCKLFDKLGWPGIVVGMALFFSYTILPQHQQALRDVRKDMEETANTVGEMKYFLEDLLRMVPLAEDDKLSMQLRIRGIE